MYKMFDEEGDLESKKSLTVRLIKRFVEEANSRGFVKKLKEKMYENERGDIISLDMLRPYTLKIDLKKTVYEDEAELKAYVQGIPNY